MRTLIPSSRRMVRKACDTPVYLECSLAACGVAAIGSSCTWNLHSCHGSVAVGGGASQSCPTPTRSLSPPLPLPTSTQGAIVPRPVPWVRCPAPLA